MHNNTMVNHLTINRVINIYTYKGEYEYRVKQSHFSSPFSGRYVYK